PDQDNMADWKRPRSRGQETGAATLEVRLVRRDNPRRSNNLEAAMSKYVHEADADFWIGLGIPHADWRRDIGDGDRVVAAGGKHFLWRNIRRAVGRNGCQPAQYRSAHLLSNRCGQQHAPSNRNTLQ